VSNRIVDAATQHREIERRTALLRVRVNSRELENELLKKPFENAPLKPLNSSSPILQKTDDPDARERAYTERVK
jgi:hypothetical protein